MEAVYAKYIYLRREHILYMPPVSHYWIPGIPGCLVYIASTKKFRQLKGKICHHFDSEIPQSKVMHSTINTIAPKIFDSSKQ